MVFWKPMVKLRCFDGFFGDYIDIAGENELPFLIRKKEWWGVVGKHAHLF